MPDGRRPRALRRAPTLLVSLSTSVRSLPTPVLNDGTTEASGPTSVLPRSSAMGRQATSVFDGPTAERRESTAEPTEVAVVFRRAPSRRNGSTVVRSNLRSDCTALAMYRSNLVPDRCALTSDRSVLPERWSILFAMRGSLIGNQRALMKEFRRVMRDRCVFAEGGRDAAAAFAVLSWAYADVIERLGGSCAHVRVPTRRWCVSRSDAGKRTRYLLSRVETEKHDIVRQAPSLNIGAGRVVRGRVFYSVADVSAGTCFDTLLEFRKMPIENGGSAYLIFLMSVPPLPVGGHHHRAHRGTA